MENLATNKDPTFNPYLRILSDIPVKNIPACLGGIRGSIAHAHSTFVSIDTQFNSIHLKTRQPRTHTTPARVYEMNPRRNATFLTLFGSLCTDLVKRYRYSNLHKLRIERVEQSLLHQGIVFDSQEQITKFVQRNEHCFHAYDLGMFFLFSEMVQDRKKVYVARVCSSFKEEKQIGLYDLNYRTVWYAQHRHRIATPVRTIRIV